jgi:hypothetical protein
VLGGAHLGEFEDRGEFDGFVRSAVITWKRWLHRSDDGSTSYMSTGVAARTDTRHWAS